MSSSTALITLDQLAPAMLVQIRADIDDAYSGLPALVQAVRGRQVFVCPLVPHRGGVAFAYRPGHLLPIAEFPHPHRLAEWIREQHEVHLQNILTGQGGLIRRPPTPALPPALDSPDAGAAAQVGHTTASRSRRTSGRR